uniref:Uncharacterized protein n=1 Tax=viral metagenome TaxID=1070528 RepID=A0A6C0FIY6_9ZZZZ|tara:strand:+ start:15043 stop:15432 length:390 start_codon:yes stop_codon:yes gene_type:complete
MDQKTLLKAFNDHFDEFVNDIVTIFPDNMDIRSAKSSIQLLRKANPKMLIGIWNSYISSKYSQQIDAGDISFFIDNDYTDDVSAMESSTQIMEAVDKLRQPIRDMGDDNREKTMKYIQNLKKICDLYFM